jgi:hypothetical protein
VVDLLAPAPDHTEHQAASCVRALRLIGTQAAKAMLDHYLDDRRETVTSELALAVNPLSVGAILDRVLRGEPLPPQVATQVIDIKPLQEHSELKRLDLRGTTVTDLAPLAGLTGLQSLNLRGTAVTDLGPLKGLTGLQTLYLRGTAVTDLAPLAGLTGLQTLDLERTRVADLGPLKGLTGLQTLYLIDTAVTDLGPLTGRTGLDVILPVRKEATSVERVVRFTGRMPREAL